MDRFIPTTLPFTKKKLPVGVILSYAFDYGIIVVLAVIYSAIDIIVTPFNQPFSLRNYTIQYPFAVKERIPILLAGIVCVVVPMIIIAFYTLILDGLFSHRRKSSGARWTEIYRLKDRLWELNCGILGLLLAEGAAFVITGSLKNLCGKPRPDLIARCQPLDGSVDPPVFGLSTRAICTQTDKAIMADGFRSFPSGHSSTAFAGLFYLSLYLAGKLHVLDNRGQVWRTLIVLIPTLAASCVAMSRIMDARHHPFDVLFGSALGILVAWASYRQYFPPLTETWRKGRAYPIRTWGTETKPPPFASDNDIMQREPDMEPFRTTPAGTAVPDMSAASSLPQDVVDERKPGHSPGNDNTDDNNVFRDQISRSQRQRQGQPQHAHPDHFDDAGIDTTNPYTRRRAIPGAGYTSPRQRDHDDDWSATASSDGNDETYRGNNAGRRQGDPEGIEMQPSARHQAHASIATASSPTRDLENQSRPYPPPPHHQRMTHPPSITAAAAPTAPSTSPSRGHARGYDGSNPAFGAARPTTHPGPGVAATAADHMDADAATIRDEERDPASTAYRASTRQAESIWSPLEPHPGARVLA